MNSIIIPLIQRRKNIGKHLQFCVSRNANILRIVKSSTNNLSLIHISLTAIGQAQNTAVSAVTEEGQKQATAVQETGTQAVSEVDAAKTAAVEAVASEGDKQVGRVKEAAAEIAADREQIQKNKTDIAALTDKTNTLAPGIVLGAKGGAIACLLYTS